MSKAQTYGTLVNVSLLAELILDIEDIKDLSDSSFEEVRGWT